MIPITCNAVGDIIALATLVIDVARALNDTRGSSSEYRAFVDELNAVHAMLTSAARVAQDSVDGVLRDQVIRTVDQCGRDIQRALARIVKFSELERDGVARDKLRLKMKRNWYKVEWRLVQRDEAQTVRKELATATQRLTTLLVISNADGAARLRETMLSGFDALLRQNDMLSRALHSNTAIVGDIRTTTRSGHALVQELSNSVPTGVDGRTAAIAVLCTAICAMHAPYDRTLPAALLLIAIYILLQSSGCHGRALVHDVSYSANNAVTLLDATGRSLVLPIELCATYDVLHATLVNLFSQTDGRWFIDTHRYRITGWYETGTGVYAKERHRAKAGCKLEMDITVQNRHGYDTCPVCRCHLPTRFLDGSCHRSNCVQCKRMLQTDRRDAHIRNRLRMSNIEMMLDNLEIGTDDYSRFLRTRPIASSSIQCAKPELTRCHDVSPPASGRVPLDRQDHLGEHRLTPHLPWDVQLRSFQRIHVCGPAKSWLDEYAQAAHPDESSASHHLELHTAAENGHYALVKKLLDEGIDANGRGRSGSGYTALHLASIYGHTRVAELLLDRGAAIDAIVGQGVTALACAVSLEHREIEALLLSRGAIVDAPRAVQVILLHAAASVDNWEITLVLLHLGLDPDVRFFNRTALQIAVQKRSLRVVAVLLRSGADINVHYPTGDTPLSILARWGDASLFSYCVAAIGGIHNCAWPSTVGKGAHKRLLQQAILGGAHTIVATVCEGIVGVDLNERFEDGRTPLSLASERGCDELVKLLLAKGANLDGDALRQGMLGTWKALHVAIYEGHVSTVRILLEHGTDVNTRTESGDTPLSLALKRKHLRRARYLKRHNNVVVNMLLSRGAVTNEQSSPLSQEPSSPAGQSNIRSGVDVPGAWREDIE